MTTMKKASIAFVALGMVAGSASAADMPVKAQSLRAPSAIYNWSGFYAGGNVGYSWGSADTDFNAEPVTANIINNPPITAVGIPGFVGSESVRPTGAIGGGQIGYNQQFARNWVAGFEADIQASGEKAANQFSNPFNFTVRGGAGSAFVTGAALTDYEAKISWFGTVRGRVGYAWDRLMLYATAGLAYGEVQMGGTRTVAGTVFGLPISSTVALGHSQLNAGWTLGAGIEAALVGNWTWKAEYLYVDLGSLDDPDAPAPRITSVTGGKTLTHTSYVDNIGRIGLNYKFQ